MKLYRVQVRYKEMYLNKILEAESDKAALEKFATEVESGAIQGTDEGFYDPDRVYLTFEEVDKKDVNVTTSSSGETELGTQMGEASYGG